MPDAGLQLPEITLPVALVIERFEVTDLRRAGDPDALLDRLRLSGRGRDSRWRDLALLAPIRDYPQRHASTLLVFEAVCACLDSLS